MSHFKPLILFLITALLLLGISSVSASPHSTPVNGQAAYMTLDEARVVAENAHWGSNVSIRFDGAEMVFTSDGLPDHGVLAAYQGLNPNGNLVASAREQQYEFRMPLLPVFAEEKTPTSQGAIGVAISGAVFFNPYEADGQTVANDDNFVVDGVPFIDDCGGHPVPNSGMYHYHGVPYCTTAHLDQPGQHSVLIGYLFDGIPVYGPQDVDGEDPTDLDECNGHVGLTPEFSGEIYHYHMTDYNPYSVKCFAGEIDTSIFRMPGAANHVHGQQPPGGPPAGGGGQHPPHPPGGH